MVAYVLFYNGKLKGKVTMHRNLTAGDPFRFDGIDCVVESVKLKSNYTEVQLTDKPQPINLDHSFPFRKKRRAHRMVVANND